MMATTMAKRSHRLMIPLLLMAPVLVSLVIYHSLPPLEEKLVSQNEQVRVKAQRKLTGLPAEDKLKLVGPLVAYLKDPESRVVNRAVDALVMIGPASVPALEQSLKEPDLYTRLSAASALGRLGPISKSAVPTLVASLNDPHPLMREETAHALGNIGEGAAPEAVSSLLKMAKDADPALRDSAAEALKKMGVQPPSFR
jgi:HEAT repeat protein